MRTTLRTGGADGPRLVLHRSTASRIAALVLLVLALLLLGVMGLRAFSGPFNQDSRDSFWMVAIYLAAPMALLAINMLRRRTVLSARGIEMRRLLWTEHRPWPATPSGLTISVHMLNGRVGGSRIEWYRLALVDGMPDELVRLPGCVFTGIGRFNPDVRDQARMALRDIQEFAVRQGWIVSDPRAVAADPRLVEARATAGSAGAASGPLTYRAPAWRQIWEYLCDAGLFLLCLGASFTAIAAGFLLDPDRTGENVFYAVLILAVALAALGYCAVKLAPFVRRTVVDREGIHVGRATHPWPGSRSGLYVAGDRVVLVHPDGYAIPLPGTGGVWGGFVRREMRATAQCEEIWCWGVANGVARDGGAYVPLRWQDGQREREIHERRAGTAPDPR